MSIEQVNFDEIIDDTLTQFQHFLQETDADLDVHRLSDSDYNELSSRDFPLNWSYIISDKLALDGCFDFGLTWQEKNQLVGAFISAFKPNEQSLEIYAIERLEQNVLNGKMMFYSLYVCYLLVSLIDCGNIKAIDVEENNKTLRDFYKSFGFKELNEQDFILTKEDLAALFNKGG